MIEVTNAKPIKEDNVQWEKLIQTQEY
jgi:hypothetical protein